MTKQDDFLETVLKIRSNLVFTSFDENTYVLSNAESNAIYRVNKIVKNLLDLFDGKRTINDVTKQFNEQYEFDFTCEQVTDIVKNQCIGRGIFDHDEIIKKRTKNEYLKIRIDLIPFKVVQKVSKLFSFLFQPKSFISIGLFCLLILFVIMFKYISFKHFYDNFSPDLLTYFILFNLSSIILHEFGHASACTNFGAKSGAIGFGFYLFTPVFYADVTDVWRLKKHQRIIVDLAGIYMQLIFCFILSLIFLLSSNIFFLNIAILILATTFINLNPFLRYDGYWVLSDALGVPNLRNQSFIELRLLLKFLFKKDKTYQLTKKNLFLAVYSLLSILFIINFLLFSIIFNYESILYFPYNIFKLFEALLVDFHALTFKQYKNSIVKLILPFTFYILIWRHLIKFLKQTKKLKNEK